MTTFATIDALRQKLLPSCRVWDTVSEGSTLFYGRALRPIFKTSEDGLRKVLGILTF